MELIQAATDIGQRSLLLDGQPGVFHVLSQQGAQDLDGLPEHQAIRLAVEHLGLLDDAEGFGEGGHDRVFPVGWGGFYCRGVGGLSGRIASVDVSDRRSLHFDPD